jgi:hypothetical protein
MSEAGLSVAKLERQWRPVGWTPSFGEEKGKRDLSAEGTLNRKKRVVLTNCSSKRFWLPSGNSATPGKRKGATGGVGSRITGLAKGGECQGESKFRI